MKKKSFILVLICFVLLFGFCGCFNKEKNLFNKEDRFNKVLEENYYGYGWGEYNSEGIICEELKDAVAYTYHYFLTDSGDIYRFHANQLFSNEKNCIKTDLGNSDLSFIYNRGFYNKNHQLVYTSMYDEDLLTPEEFQARSGYPLSEAQHITDDYDFITESDSGDVILIKNHSIYGYKTSYYGNTPPERVSLGEIPQDEEILYLSGALIKTDKAIYSLSILNEEECNKYVDIKCITQFTKNSLTDFYDRIIFINENMLVDDQFHVYGQGRSYSIEN